MRDLCLCCKPEQRANEKTYRDEDIHYQISREETPNVERGGRYRIWVHEPRLFVRKLSVERGNFGESGQRNSFFWNKVKGKRDNHRGKKRRTRNKANNCIPG